MTAIARIHRRARGRSRSRGQALVEFVLVAPLFFLILFAIIDFGRYVYYVQILNNAAREGARYAIVHGALSVAPTGPPSADASGTAVKDEVRRYAIGVVGIDDPTVLDIQATWDPDNSRDNPVTVTVTYQFHSVIPLVPIPAFAVKGESTLVINN